MALGRVTPPQAIGATGGGGPRQEQRVRSLAVSTEVWVQLVGYLGSALVIASLAQKSILRLRFIGLGGSATFLVYSLLIAAYPIAIVNLIAGAIHAYYLRQLIARPEEVFSTLEVRPDAFYLQRFLEFHAADIARFQPEFRHQLGGNMKTVFILRDMVPAGLVVCRADGDAFKIVLDYAIPEYRDFKLGRYVFSRNSGIFESGARLWSPASTPDHATYLQRMGFRQTGEDRFELEVGA
jgi:hypothetical protein